MSMILTAEQLKRMEENRLRALEKKKPAATLNSTASTTINTGTSSNANKPATSSTTAGNKIVTMFNKQASATSSTTLSATAGTSPSSNAFIKPTSSTNPNILIGKCVPFAEDPENRFEIRVGYNKGLIDLFKTITGRKFDPATKNWNFSMKNYTEIIGKVNALLKNEVRLEPLEKTKPKIIARCILIDRKSFEVQTMYNAELQEEFKKIPSKRYEPQLKRWSFDLKDYERLLKAVNEKLSSTVAVIPLPKCVREVFKSQIEGANKEKFENSIEDSELREKLDSTIIKNLLPFQYDGIKFAINLNGRILLADDMGLGKTVQALSIMNYYKADWPALVITPSSVKFMWKESAKRWLPNVLNELSVDGDIDTIIQVLENQRQPINPWSKIVICSYDLLIRMVDELVEFNFKVIVADECHFLKNGKAERTKSALKLFEKCTRLICLSGTPALSRPAELYSQVSAICPSLFNSFHEFGMRYCDGKESKFGMDFSGASNMKELQLVLEEKVMIRREKTDVITQLPSKLREMIILDPALIELNKKGLQEASKEMKNDKLKGMEKRGALLKFFQETSVVKANAVCEYVREFLDSGKKFILFAHHQTMLDAVQAECEKGKYDFIRIDGSTNSEKRKLYVDKFQTNEVCRIAILSITAANSGITLTEANMVLFAELFWNPGILVQAEDRVYRIGQRNSVLIQYLCAKSTADDYIWPLVNEKLSVLSKAGLTKENLSEASTISKLSNLTNKIDGYMTTVGDADVKNEILEVSLDQSILDDLVTNDELFSQIKINIAEQNNNTIAKPKAKSTSIPRSPPNKKSKPAE